MVTGELTRRIGAGFERLPTIAARSDRMRCNGYERQRGHDCGQSPASSLQPLRVGAASSTVMHFEAFA